MKTIKKITSFFLCIIVLITLISCNKTEKVKFSFVDENSTVIVEVNKGDLVDEPSQPSKKGYKFLGWYAYEELWNFDKDIATKDTTLVALFMANNYKVTYDYNGGNGNATYDIATYDSKFLGTEAWREGYDFVGWTYNDVKIDIWNITNDATVVAKWKGRTTRVIFKIDDHPELTETIATYGEKFVFPDLRKEGYTLSWIVQFKKRGSKITWFYGIDHPENDYIWEFDTEEAEVRCNWYKID